MNSGEFNELSNYISLSRSFDHPGIQFFDTHCHIDKIFENEGYRGTFNSFMESKKSTWAKCYGGCISDFCFPETYMIDEEWKTILTAAPNIYGAFGCHPHSANMYTDEVDRFLRTRLLDPKVIAIGEMGLDFSSKNHVDHDVQKSVFRRQLKMGVELNKPIVIHCRDAEEDCFEIMQKIVPPNHPIHRHCFLESIEDANRLVDHFTALKIGLTPAVLSPRSEGLMRVVREFPLDKILIETDAPYFLPGYFKTAAGGNMRSSHPGMGFLVGAKLAFEREKNIIEILDQIRKNTRDVYGI